MVRSGNLLSDLSKSFREEQFDTLLARPGVRIERIVSTGQASPEGFWYDQAETEWVCVIAGAAALLIEGEAQPHMLKAGDWLEIAPHVRHRVEWTETSQPTIWLAMHIGA
ncbi:MAG: cupin domain-containing protein [Rhodoblastus sp.]|nr:cupin domain-containing protein [Rhodoblastus sp.]